MKVKIVDNKSDATTPITTTQEISTSTNNTKSLSEPNNDLAILKSIKIWFVNLNLVNDKINNILTEDVVVNKILMQLLNLLPIKHRALCIVREVYLPNGAKFKATSKIKNRLEELESAEKKYKICINKNEQHQNTSCPLSRCSNIKCAALKKICFLCVIKDAKLQMLLDDCKLYHNLKR